MDIKKIFNCKVKRKIVHFFHNNPASIDSLRGIMTWTGLAKKEATKALEELVKYGVLMAHRSTSTVGYAYTGDKKLIDKIKKYFQYFQDEVK